MRHTAMLLVLVFFGANCAFISAEETSPAKMSKSWTNIGSLTATVEDVNKKTRELTVRVPDGNVVTVEAGPDLKNFDQIKKGDKIVANYLESTELIVRKPEGKEAPATQSDVSVETAGKGEKPGGAISGTVEVTATVESIDYKKRTVVLLGPEGEKRTVNVPLENKRFNEVKKGDVVVAQVTKSVEISVEKAEK